MALDGSGNLFIADPLNNRIRKVSFPNLPAVSLSIADLAFGDQGVGTTSTAQTVTLTNTGGGVLTITGIAVSVDFAQTNDCGASLAAETGCSIDVAFTPTVTGLLSGDLTIASDDPSGPQIVALSGTGIAPAVSLSSTSLTFVAQLVGATGDSQIVTLTNTGSASLNISSIVASGDFAQTNDCGASVAAAESCTITVSFTPTGDGIRTGEVIISSNDPNSPQSIILTGEGIGVVSDLTLSASSLTFCRPVDGYDEQCTECDTHEHGQCGDKCFEHLYPCHRRLRSDERLWGIGSRGGKLCVECDVHADGYRDEDGVGDDCHGRGGQPACDQLVGDGGGVVAEGDGAQSTGKDDRSGRDGDVSDDADSGRGDRDVFPELQWSAGGSDVHGGAGRDRIGGTGVDDGGGIRPYYGSDLGSRNFSGTHRKNSLAAVFFCLRGGSKHGRGNKAAWKHHPNAKAQASLRGLGGDSADGGLVDGVRDGRYAKRGRRHERDSTRHLDAYSHGKNLERYEHVRSGNSECKVTDSPDPASP